MKPGRTKRHGAAGRLRRAWRGLHTPWAAGQAVLCGAVLAAAVLWLEIPDGSWAGQGVSGVTAVGGMLLAVYAESAILRAARRPERRRELWPGAAWLVAMGAAGWLLWTLLRAGAMQDEARAMLLLNRTFLWHVASRTALLQGEGVLWWMARWTLVGLVLPMTMEGTAERFRGTMLQASAAPLTRWLYWAVVLGAAGVATVVTEGLLGFQPTVPIPLEALLTVGKAVAIFAVDVGAACFVLSLVGTYLRDAERKRQAARSRRPVSGRRVPVAV